FIYDLHASVFVNDLLAVFVDPLDQSTPFKVVQFNMPLISNDCLITVGQTPLRCLLSRLIKNCQKE
ncbi:MAG: hypothetical protein IKI63_00475, partial [Clostridia bacterium]|nr:hypothetical protein [Clostridia bacterium]